MERNVSPICETRLRFANELRSWTGTTTTAAVATSSFQFRRYSAMAVSTTSPTPRGSRATSGRPPSGLAPPGAGGSAAGGGPPASNGPSGSGGATDATGLRSGGPSDSAAANGRSLGGGVGGGPHPLKLQSRRAHYPLRSQPAQAP